MCQKRVVFLRYRFLNFLNFSGISSDFSGIFTDLILLKKAKGLNLSRGTLGADMAHDRHLDACVAHTWCLHGVWRSLGWQVMGPRVSGPK